jgi:predicted NBD/HSP70 family sugar kinase
MLQKADSDLVRRHNRGLVLETLRRHGPMARVGLGHVTGLSPASITSISASMLAEGLLRIEGDVLGKRGQRGRPQTRLALNPAAAYVIALAISADGSKLAVADFAGTIVGSAQLDIDTFHLASGEFAPIIANRIRSYVQKHGPPLTSIARISIAIQGVADTNEGTIAWSPAFEARDIPVSWPLAKLLGIPCVIANNANRIADGLLAEDPGKYGGTSAVVFLGHGVGLGLILDGKVFEGASGRASEFGHMNHDPAGPLCRCGMHGCLEAFSADYGILRMARNDSHEDVGIHKPVPAGMMEEVQRAAEAGERRARKAFERAGEVLGFGLARLIALINPRLVVFTGPGTGGFHLMRASLEQALARSLVDDLRKDVAFEVMTGNRDLIVAGTLTDALNHLDREMFAAAGPGAA